MLIGQSALFEINLSVPLVLEYEDVAKRPGLISAFSEEDIDAVIDRLCLMGHRQSIFFSLAALPERPKRRYGTRAGR